MSGDVAPTQAMRDPRRDRVLAGGILKRVLELRRCGATRGSPTTRSCSKRRKINCIIDGLRAWRFERMNLLVYECVDIET